MKDNRIRFRFKKCLGLIALLLSSSAFAQQHSTKEYGEQLQLPAPLETKPTNKFAKVIGWPEGKKPTAPEGFEVRKFAADLNSPRWIYQAPNGDIFVAEARTGKPGKGAADDPYNKILIFKDTNADGVADSKSVYLSGLNQPLGMLILDNFFYVANTDGLYRYPYDPNAKELKGKGEKIVDLPAGGYNNHWTRNIIADPNGKKIYISVGSGSNVGENGMEHEHRRAAILQINPDGSGEQIYASGIRNPVGMDWDISTGKLWTAVNERDELGDQLVADYITSVQAGKFYGWPYTYWGNHIDPRWKDKKRPEVSTQTVVPDYALGAHTASLGLAFNRSGNFPNGAYIGQHGSWNRSEFVGYKVIYVPFKDGKPSGQPQDFLHGFIADASKSEVYGRPVAVYFTKQGYLLVSDDAGNAIWTVMPKR